MAAIRLVTLLAVIVSLALPAVATARLASVATEGGWNNQSHIGGELLLCGQVTEFTAPDGVATDGAMTMNGVSDPDPHGFVIGATATIAPADAALLTALAGTDSFTCLDAVGDGMGVLIEVAILPSAQFCGSVEPAGSTWRLTDSDFPDLTTTLTGEAEAILDADVRLHDLLAWFDQFDNEACLTLATDATGVVTEITLDGELLVCGAVAYTSESATSAVLEYDGPIVDEAVRPDIVGLGGIILPASLFSDAAIGLLELAYAAQNHPAYDGFADVCALIPVATTELLPASMADSSVGICGWFNIGALTIGLTDHPAPDWNWFAVLFNGLSGLDSAPGSDSNVESAMIIGDPACLLASVDGGPGAETVDVTAGVDDCAEVVARSSEAITLGVGETQAVFRLTPGSSVDAALIAGATSEISLTASAGEDGAVVIEQTQATCDGTGGGDPLPDTATVAPQATAMLLALLVLVMLVLAGRVARAGRARRRI